MNRRLRTRSVESVERMRAYRRLRAMVLRCRRCLLPTFFGFAAALLAFFVRMISRRYESLRFGSGLRFCHWPAFPLRFLRRTPRPVSGESRASASSFCFALCMVVATRGFLLWTEEHRRLLRWRRPTFPNSFHSLGFANSSAGVSGCIFPGNSQYQIRVPWRASATGLLLTTVTRPRAISWTWSLAD